MNRTLVHGGVIALVAAVAAALGDLVSLTSIWPVLLAAGAGLVATPSLGRGAAFIVGAGSAWLVVALRAGVLPDATVTDALLAVVTVVLLTAVALVSRERLPLWMSLLGFVAFAALYEPLYASAPTAFLSESPVAFVSVLLAASLGFLAASLAAGIGERQNRGDLVLTIDEPAVAGEAEA